VLDLVRDGSPVYAWPYERRDVWRMPRTPRAAGGLQRLIGG